MKGTSNTSSKHSTSRKSNSQKEVKRPIELYFEELASFSQDQLNRKLQIVFLPLFLFGLMTMIWMIPFPEIEFLKRHGYHIFLNWGSFFIAGLIYFYLRLAPTLSYFVLLSIGVMSFLIVQLEYWEKVGGPAVWLVGLLICLISLLVLFRGSQRESKKPTLAEFAKILLIGPIWLWHFVFKRFKWKY